MARGFPGDYICTKSWAGATERSSPIVVSPHSSSRKSCPSIPFIEKYTYPSRLEKKSQWSSDAEERKVPKNEEEGIRLEWRPQSFEVGALVEGRGRRKAGSPFSTVGGPRPHSRNRLQNVLFTWFEGALSSSSSPVSLVLFSRVLILFSHTFFSFLFFLSSATSSSSSSRTWTSFLNGRSSEEDRCKVRFRDDFRDKCHCCIAWPRFEERGDSGTGWSFVATSFQSFSQFRGWCYWEARQWNDSRNGKSLIASSRWTIDSIRANTSKIKNNRSRISRSIRFFYLFESK